MKRSLFLAATLCALLLPACKNKDQQSASRVEEPYVPLEQDNTRLPSQGDAFAATEPMTTTNDADYEATADTTANDEVLAPSDTAGSRTYTVQKGDTLYGLARKFYNDQARWKDIWEANRTRLSDPNKLSVGTKLIIP